MSNACGRRKWWEDDSGWGRELAGALISAGLSFGPKRFVNISSHQYQQSPIPAGQRDSRRSSDRLANALHAYDPPRFSPKGPQLEGTREGIASRLEVSDYCWLDGKVKFFLRGKSRSDCRISAVLANLTEWAILAALPHRSASQAPTRGSLRFSNPQPNAAPPWPGPNER